MNYLIEKLIQQTVIQDYSSVVYRTDFSNAKYKFVLPIEGMTIDEVKKTLIDDIYKITLSVRKNTGGVKHLTDEDFKEVEESSMDLSNSYGGSTYILKILSPQSMIHYTKYKNMKFKKYYIPIPGRPICKRTKMYHSKITGIISNNGCLKNIETKPVEDIMKEIETYGLENISSFSFYVYEPILSGYAYNIFMVYDFKDDGELIFQNIQKNNEERKQKEREEQEKMEKWERDRKDYFRRKQEYLSKFKGPGSYYAEKAWISNHGDSRFESDIDMRNSNYTGD